MRNFNIMALEERIVLDATLFNAADFITTTVNVGQAVDLSGVGGYVGTKDGWSVNFVPIESGGPNPIATLNTDGGSPLVVGQVGSNATVFAGNLRFDVSAQSVTYGAPGVYHPYLSFSNTPDPFTNLVIGEITVVDNTAPFVVSSNPITAQEGTKLNQVLATVYEPNGLSIFSSSVSNTNFVLTNLTISPNASGGNLYDISGDVALNDLGSGFISITLQDASGNLAQPYVIAVNATDAPLTRLSNAAITSTEGRTLQNQLLGTFKDANQLTNASAFLAGLTVTPNDSDIFIDPSSLQIVKVADVRSGGNNSGNNGGVNNGGNGNSAPAFYFEVRGDITFKDVVTNGSLAIHIQDADGGLYSPLEFSTAVSAVDALLTAGPQQTVSLVEGGGIPLTPVLVATFTDANPFADIGDFAGSISGLPAGLISAPFLTFAKNGNDFNVYANISGALGNDAGLVTGSVKIFDVNDGSMLSAPLQFNINPAPWNLGPVLSVEAKVGLPLVAKIGSFVDTNLNELINNYSVSVDNNTLIAGDGGATGYLVKTGQGTYDVYANLQYDASGVIQGSYIIKDLTNLDPLNPNPAETLSGAFNANVRAGQLLWGVDENSNQLFSVADYAVAGAEGRVTLYGQLHTALGNVDGKVQAFTIDGADASGKNAAYIAISGLEDGLNNFSIGVIADINDAANRTEVTLYKIAGLKFDAQRDRITGLAVDPISGNLMGVVTRSGSPDTLFVIDKNTLSSADHIAKGYTIGKIIGHDDLGGQKVTNARDLAFDENGNLFVTDGTKDKLYRISSGTGEILEVVNMNEDNGVGEANIEALAWDPVLNKMVGANALLNGGNDLVGLSLENGPNSIDVHLLQSLGDIQGMAFAPEFALRAGDDLGVLIDVARSEVQYEVGDGPMLLLRNVELVSFGEDTYDGGSLTVDVSGVDVNEFFAIKAGDGIKINAAGEIRYKGLWIGTIDALNNGKNGNALTVNFTANAGERAVESLMERITYLNTNSTLALGERVISFTIKDSLGAIIGYTTIDLQIEAEDSSHC